MTEKGSSLPHVLQEYNPEYTPVPTPQHKSRGHVCSREKSASSQGSKIKTKGKPGHLDAEEHQKALQKKKRADDQRYEELSEKWDQAKHEVRQEDHDLLREKCNLQQALIRKQDEYAEQKRQQQLQQENEKRESERAKKLAKQEELQQICKQSLEDDRRSQREEKKAKTKVRNDSIPQTPATMSPSPTRSPSTPTTPGGRRSNPFKMTLPAVAPTPDIGEDDEDEKPSTPEISQKVLAWHEQQLYKLYGKGADYFLHPKIETKTMEKKGNAKLRRQGVDRLFESYGDEPGEGRAGAEALWQTLRYDSSQRLLKEDQIIPDELKEAYGSFARQSLKKNKIPVQRMFCTVDDLPEMPRLLDNRKVQRVHKMRHKSDLMFRASVSNQDRTEVLTFNNPLPEFHERTDSIDQYLPSWQDFDSESTQPAYTVWLKNRNRQDTIVEEDQPQVTQSMDEDLIMMMSRRPQNQPKQKYVFLSEKDTTVKGMFSDKYKGERENKDIPKPYKGDMPKSYSALGGMISATPDGSKSDPSLRYSAPQATRNGLLRDYTTQWQPLSMNALVEYKKQVSTVGEGEFHLGRTKMWSHIPVV
ncbi:hypothetical protein ACF0H5_014152 [Mactra antiquata]